MKGVVEKIEVVHHPTVNYYDEKNRPCIRYARLIVWARLESGERVWIDTSEGDLDSMKVELKVAMFEHFFQSLIGTTITVKEGSGEKALFADRRSIPKKFRISYLEIQEQLKDWLLKQHKYRVGGSPAA